MASAHIIELEVTDEDAGKRLDRWLADAAGDMSRSRIQALLADGCVLGPDGRPIADAAKRVRAGDSYTVNVPPPTPAVPVAEDIPLDVLYEDTDLIVLNKPAGLVVHPAPGHASGTLVNALLHHCRGELSGIGGVMRPGIVHRLDKDTAGVMVCAKSDVAHRGLVEQFQSHDIVRAYWAVVWGQPTPKKGRIEGRIGRDPRNRKRMAVVPSGGKKAITEYFVLNPVGSIAALVDCQLFTGRTHQIRVHMASMGNPLIGDALYKGRSQERTARDPVIQNALGTYPFQALQAYLLGFTHPATAEKLRFEIKLSNKISNLIDSLEVV